MRKSETIRFACGDCRIVFDLRVAPESEWAEHTDEDGLQEFAPPGCCPFCGSSELKALHDMPTLQSRSA